MLFNITFIFLGEITSLLATNLQLDGTIAELSLQLQQFKDKVARLENLKQSLENQTESNVKDLEQKRASLEQVSTYFL